MSTTGYRENTSNLCTCIWRCVLPVTRFWGVATSVVLGGVGADHVAHKHVLGIYFIVAAFGILFLEITWAITLFLQLCIRDFDEGCCIQCWSTILWIGYWRKTLLYGILSIFPLLYPYKLWLSYVVGGQLIILAILYMILTIIRRQCRNKDCLLNNYGDVDSLDRFEEVLDDTLPEVMQSTATTDQRHSSLTSTAGNCNGGNNNLHDEQELILEI